MVPRPPPLERKFVIWTPVVLWREFSMAEHDHGDYRKRLRFLLHQAALRCKTEQELLHAMYEIGVLPGTVEYVEAKKAWLRFQKAKRYTR